jgi:hypothetical protein
MYTTGCRLKSLSDRVDNFVVPSYPEVYLCCPIRTADLCMSSSRHNSGQSSQYLCAKLGVGQRVLPLPACWLIMHLVVDIPLISASSKSSHLERLYVLSTVPFGRLGVGTEWISSAVSHKRSVIDACNIVRQIPVRFGICQGYWRATQLADFVLDTLSIKGIDPLLYS